jgi:hypothetical protein
VNSVVENCKKLLTHLLRHLISTTIRGKVVGALLRLSRQLAFQFGSRYIAGFVNGPTMLIGFANL